MILVKGLSRIDSWRHLIQWSLSSSLAADNLNRRTLVPATEPQISLSPAQWWECRQTELMIALTCSIYGFPGPPSHPCQFYILWWFPPFPSRSQTQIAFRHDPLRRARECSPGGWCPWVRSRPCVGNNKGTGHWGQTSDASSFSSFRPGMEDVRDFCYPQVINSLYITVSSVSPSAGPNPRPGPGLMAS